MKNPKLNPKTKSILKSMSLYWTEVEERPANRAPTFRHEIENVRGLLTDHEILSIISQHVNPK